MSYLTTWLISLGLGFTSVHTDVGKYPASLPLFTIDSNVKALFGRQYFSVGFKHYTGAIHQAEWAQPVFGSERLSLRNSIISAQTGGRFLQLKKYGDVFAGIGLSYNQSMGLGLNGSFSIAYPSSLSRPNIQYSLKVDFNYWGSDLMDGVVNAQDVVGDYESSLIFGIQIPIRQRNS
ncbi:hypothetical protein [Croceimicrobium hydrocarbonivorans]|uniref:Uncharacterized protein n=1 Tax=Croceimicrobium hydrocarbonivorans TaxID=2761580 RepID=A0A7H0VH90_9FLAO|nr:hypothetical protein [Croceimicrobium hydrocarbonivorans]QNR25088.1 hypothetical protein H4K34_04410 [Croceimicrobium hydrocarbonivorans]